MSIAKHFNIIPIRVRLSLVYWPQLLLSISFISLLKCSLNRSTVMFLPAPPFLFTVLLWRTAGVRLQPHLCSSVRLDLSVTGNQLSSISDSDSYGSYNIILFKILQLFNTCLYTVALSCVETGGSHPLLKNS